MKYLFFWFCFINFSAKSQEYASNLIPDSLKQNADAVLRKESLIISITDFDKAIIKHKYVITILNEMGNYYAKYEEQYDKFNSLNDINCNMYDSNGVKIKTARKKDIYDHSNFSNDFNTDIRAKSYSFSNNNYPYTVEFEDEQTLTGIYHLPIWKPIINTNFAVQNSSLEIETFLDYGLRFKQINLATNPIITTLNKKKNYLWEIKNIKAIEEESFMPSYNNIFPIVLLAPSKFVFDGYQGNMTTWKDLGNFNILLNKNRGILPENVKKIIHDLTDTINNIEDKTKTLYNYLQQNTRYISIQLGIGGWQPLDAAFVSEKKYGDCKALSNFMVSILKEAKIPAYYTVIKAGESVTTGLYEDFPMSNFNHIITCVPINKDTMWLECTSQTESAGYTGNFTGNRKALLISDEGGVVVATPKYEADANKSVRKVSLTIDEIGNAKIFSTTLLAGIKQNFAHNIIYNTNQEEKKKYLNNILKLPSYTVIKSDYSEKKGKIPEITEQLTIDAPSYATVTSKRLFVAPNLFNKVPAIESNKPRQHNIFLNASFKEIDTVIIKIPIGYTLETIPQKHLISNMFFKYQSYCEFEKNTLVYYRFYEQNTNTFKQSMFNDFFSSYNEIYKADRTKLVFIKNNN